jgi:hypothetical protein
VARAVERTPDTGNAAPIGRERRLKDELEQLE